MNTQKVSKKTESAESSDDRLDDGIDAEKKEHLKELGRLVREAINDNESIEGFARKAGVDKSYLSRMLHGKLKAYPKVQTLEKLVSAGNGLITLNDLLPCIGMKPNSKDFVGISTAKYTPGDEMITGLAVPADASYAALTVVQNHLLRQGIYTTIALDGEASNTFPLLRVVKDSSSTGQISVQNSGYIIPFPCFYNDVSLSKAMYHIVFEVLKLTESQISSKIDKGLRNVYFVTNSKALCEKIHHDFVQAEGWNPSVVFAKDILIPETILYPGKEVAFSANSKDFL